MAKALTTYEKELIELLYKDKTSICQIAKELERSVSTISTYLKSVGLREIKSKQKNTEQEIEKPVSFDARRTLPPKKKPKLVDRMYNIKRGDIYYVLKFGVTDGSVQDSGRPAVVVSNNKNNMFSTTVEVVYLTTQPKNDMPTHVDIRSTGVKSTAVCEQVTTVSRERISNPCGVCTNAEMEMIDAALAVSLGLNFDKESVEVNNEPEPPVTEYYDHKELTMVVAERDTYKRLYEELLDKLVRR